MCGIVGFNSKNSRVLKSMLSTINHRGPDDNGVYEDSDISLGHTRLSILDLSYAGHQPMRYEHLTIVYNGEVYNFKEIRKELESEYTFKSNSDTEVVLKAFHKWGVRSVDKFRGMFAFAIYDTYKSLLYLFRDRVGVKPLYYYHKDNDFAFGSEVRTIKAYKDNLNIDKESLCEYFQYGYISSNMSIYQDVKKLPAGYYGIYDVKKRTFSTTQYWSIVPYFQKPKFNKSEKELVDELEELLIESFKYRMVSDTPVGVFLSGGIDSSIVAAILQKHYGNIHTFTIGFKEALYNEADYAKEVARHIGSTHTEEFLSASMAKEILNHFVDIYDEPFGDSSGIPTTLISQVAKKNGVKVVLSADGGDEIFCGYSRYWICNSIGQKILMLPKPLKVFMAHTMDKFGIDRASKLFKIKNFAHKYNQLSQMLKAEGWLDIYENLIHNAKSYQTKELLGCIVKNENIGFDTGLKEHPMQGMMLWDYHRYMVDDILVKVDRATMYNSIEGREPLLDHKIAEFMAQVPFEYKYKDGDSKYLLKKVLQRYIPKELIDRPKMGFGIPMFEWFGSELLDMFDNYFDKDDEYINMEFIRSELQKFKEQKAVNVNILWFALVYKMWREKYNI